MREKLGKSGFFFILFKIYIKKIQDSKEKPKKQE